MKTGFLCLEQTHLIFALDFKYSVVFQNLLTTELLIEFAQLMHLFWWQLTRNTGVDIGTGNDHQFIW